MYTNKIMCIKRLITFKNNITPEVEVDNSIGYKKNPVSQKTNNKPLIWI